MSESPVRELRVAVTVEDYEHALVFYRDALGLPVVESWDDPGGRSGAILDAGRATLELLSVPQTAHVDEVEVGRAGVSSAIRFALEVDDSIAAAKALVEAGARQLAEPAVTPWNHRNVRIETRPAGLRVCGAFGMCS